MMAKLNFQQPLLQSSEIILTCWFDAQEIFLIIINAEFFFVMHYQIFLMNGKFKRIVIFSSIAFDQLTYLFVFI